MTKKMTIAEAVLTVADAIRAVKQTQNEQQSSHDAFKQTVNEVLAQVISRDEVVQMIKKATQRYISRRDVLEQIGTLAATQTQTVDLKSHKLIQHDLCLNTEHGLIPTYITIPITFTPKTDNFISISGASVTVDVNRFITADETGDYALNSGWVIDHGRGQMAGYRLTVYEAGEIRLTHPQLNGQLIITAKALTKAEAAQQYLDSITPQDSSGSWSYTADADLLDFAKDEIDSVFWHVDSPSSLFLFNQIHVGSGSGNMSMADVFAQADRFNEAYLFTYIDGSETTGSPLKEFGFVLKDGTRLSRSFS